MNRRRFFNFLGSAIIGTAIALKLPETIVPINLGVQKPKISYQALSEAYIKCCIGEKEPDQILVHIETFKDIIEEIGTNKNLNSNLYGLTRAGFIKFRKAKIVPANTGLHKMLVDIFGFGAIAENEIHVRGSCYGNTGKYEFV